MKGTDMRFTREEINFLIAWAQEYSRIVPPGRALALAREHHAEDRQLTYVMFAAFVARVIHKGDIIDGLHDEDPTWPWASYEQFGIRAREAEESICIPKAQAWSIHIGLGLN
jgi:hypothetical protein